MREVDLLTAAEELEKGAVPEFDAGAGYLRPPLVWEDELAEGRVIFGELVAWKISPDETKAVAFGFDSAEVIEGYFPIYGESVAVDAEQYAAFPERDPVGRAEIKTHMLNSYLFSRQEINVPVELRKRLENGDLVITQDEKIDVWRWSFSWNTAQDGEQVPGHIRDPRDKLVSSFENRIFTFSLWDQRQRILRGRVVVWPRARILAASGRPINFKSAESLGKWAELIKVRRAGEVSRVSKLIGSAKQSYISRKINDLQDYAASFPAVADSAMRRAAWWASQ